MSLTHIYYVQKQKTIQVTLRIFIDDLELELNANKKKNFEIATDREPKKIDSIYLEYIINHLSIEINNHNKGYTFIGKEYENNMAIFYLEIKNIEQISQLKIENNLLLNTFPNQENVLKLNINNHNNSYILTRNTTKAFINY